MALLQRRGHRWRSLVPRRTDRDDMAHLEHFALTRRGVEAYLEPRTTITEHTVVLVATSGEWTRRRVRNPKAARALADKLGIPVYDVAATGYPRQMREWTARRRAAGDTGVPHSDEWGS